ncbi:hypothetical protein [Phytobacter sp. V91]|uniref:hypothetical protein n=1 Tax=Phytobacter sp. V91 TaxID=3369425 RepID=UPI003F63801F
MKVVADIIVIAVLALFVYIFVSLMIRDVKNKKTKSMIDSDGVDATAVITSVVSRSGGNSGFINIALSFDYVTDEGVKLHGESDAVVDATAINKYQPGEKVLLRYSKKEPEKVILNISHPLKR